jgi:acylphosphatase
MSRYFNTSGPNIPEEHYTLMREALIREGIELVDNRRYFTIWAPRQTGKSTYFRLLADELRKTGYKPVYFSVEGFNNFSIERILYELNLSLYEQQQINVNLKTINEFSLFFRENKEDKFVLIIDEIEGLNPDIFGQFLHTIRNLYHYRDEHCLKSVILVGVSNIVGIIQDHASPFNIADNLPVDYFTKEEVFRLLEMHEEETGQLFAENVKAKIHSITAGQPGLVNGFAWKLVRDNPNKNEIDYDDYLTVENWYLYLAIDKNVANIINKAKQYREFVERLLFNEAEIPFDIDRESVKFLHINGVIKNNKDGDIEFWVPLYKKRLYKAFYPYMNGERKRIERHLNIPEYLDGDQINFDKLIDNYKEYVKRRSFKYFREKDENTGKYKQIKEAALVYSFETFIQSFLNIIEAKSYMEPHTGLGRSDLIVNCQNTEYVIEAKIYRNIYQFERGKKQLAYYCKSLNINEGIYLVFVANDVTNPNIKESKEIIDDVIINVFIVIYDEEKDF